MNCGCNGKWLQLHCLSVIFSADITTGIITPEFGFSVTICADLRQAVVVVESAQEPEDGTQTY